MTEIKNRYDMMYLFDVTNGNPNGDPDMDNMPRTDPETGIGLVSDVCIKRKIRNYVSLTHGNEDGYEIFVAEKAVLNDRIGAEWDKAAEGRSAAEVRKSKADGDIQFNARQRLCRRYFDIRAFGAVLSTGEKNAGQVRGPLQFTFANSFDPVSLINITMTRGAVTKAEDAEKARTMGHKYIIPSGLYKGYAFLSPALAAQTGYSQEDFELTCEALLNMFDHDRSAARGFMTLRQLFVFKHATPLGSCAPIDLFERVKIRKAEGVSAPRSYSDYIVTLDGKVITERKVIIDV